MKRERGAIVLPAPITRRLDAMVRDFLQVPDRPEFDFSTPPGAPALAEPTSVSWQIFRNPVTLFIGGVAAVLLELGEPRVRDAVWHRGGFRADPLGRLKRTGLAAMITVYGARQNAKSMIAGVVRMHGEVAGETAAGEAYRADDPDLLDWVQTTAVYGFMQACHVYLRPLDAGERDRLLAEARPAALLYGAAGAPADEAALERLFARMEGRLDASPVVLEFLDIMNRVPALPAPLRPLQRLLVRAATDLLPDAMRERLGLGGFRRPRRWERAMVRAAARAADRILLPSLPAVQACRRLGLADDHLHRRA